MTLAPQPLDILQLVADVDATIAGHLHPAEAMMLAVLASQLPPRATIVELGALVGKSSVLLGAGVLAGRAGQVHSIDLFAIPRGGLPDKPSEPSTQHADFSNDYNLGELFRERSQLEVFQNHIQGVGLQQVVRPIASDSAAAADRFLDGTIDLLFVDASHEYDDVRRDLTCWFPKVRPGGLIACHDYFPTTFPGVVRAVDETLRASRAVHSAITVRALFVCRKAEAPAS